MANQELHDKQYSVPSGVINYIQRVLVTNPTSEGIKRAKYLVKNGSVTYQELKRLKNFFDNFNTQSGDKVQYALAGGNLMKAFVDSTLNQQRAGVARSKETKRDMTANPNSELKPNSSMPRLSEAEKKEEKQKNAVAVIVDKDNKILLLKRGKDAPWQPSKWALVGGGIEKGESPQQAIEREIQEEIGLEFKNFVKTFTIQRNPNSIEHVFACRYEGDPAEITLNGENTNYGWYDIGEMEFLEIVPNLIEYITLAFTGEKYD